MMEIVEQRKHLLPAEVRAILMTRYILAKESNTTPDQFVNSIEDSLSAWAISAVIESTRSIFRGGNI